MCTLVFIASLFTITRTWKQSKCPLTDEWIKKIWCVYTMEYYSAIKKEQNDAFAATLDGPRDYHVCCTQLLSCVLSDSSVRGDPLGRNTEVGCHALLQGIVPTQGSNPGLAHCRRILREISHLVDKYHVMSFVCGSKKSYKRMGLQNRNRLSENKLMVTKR